MTIFGNHISPEVRVLLADCFQHASTVIAANHLMQEESGVVDFFTQEEFETIKISITEGTETINEPDRTAYGDFQTNHTLAKAICRKLANEGVNPQIVVEPTFGLGNFILAVLEQFPTVQEIYGVEIYHPYCWHTKLAIVEYFLHHPKRLRPAINLFNISIFNFNWEIVRKNLSNKNLLIIGNPPWVTNAALSSLDSENVPRKMNLKHHAGLDAMTGKANFDLGESITLSLLDTFHNCSGAFAFLVKNAVIRNILTEQRRRKYRIGRLEQLSINAQKEFGAAVEAALLRCDLNESPVFDCRESDFYTGVQHRTFGWVGDKFVADIDHYEVASELDGRCPWEWRQGIKHDCSKVMELEPAGDNFINGLGETVALEPALMFGLLKSSDLKGPVITKVRKYTIVTQTKIGQDTKPIQQLHPLTWQYLFLHREFLDARKSSIYKGNPPFSIFGIGDYSFKPYKVAISGLYKQTQFSLVMPAAGKCLMLDDTGYFLGFDDEKEAVFALLLLNSIVVQTFLRSIVFFDNKRLITKEILMRIDLRKAAAIVPFLEINTLAKTAGISFDFDDWENELARLNQVGKGQMQLF